MHSSHEKEMEANLIKYQASFQGKSILLFGHCNASEVLADSLLSNNNPPVCFLDNNKTKQGTCYKNIPIVSVEKIQEFSPENSVVLIVSRFYHSMKQQLRRLSYKGDILELVEYNSFQAFSLEEDVFKEKEERVKKGCILLEKLSASGEHLLICPHQALGDVYWIMAYLPAYLEKHKVSSCTVVVASNPCRDVVSLFGFESVLEITVLPQKELASLVQAVIFTRAENILLAHHNYVYTDPTFSYLTERLIPFCDYYKEVILNLPAETQETQPQRNTSFTPPPEMVQGQSVIFAPYANSMVEISPDFWESLAKSYEEKGFSLYTNLLDGQVPISGTTPLVLPLTEMISAVEWAGHFISIRSGLCDVIHSANCEKTLVFPHCSFSTTKHLVKDFFPLEGWQIIEVESERNVT